MPKGIPTSGKRVRHAPLKTPASCAIEDCESVRIGRGYCHKHYARFKRHGDPEFKLTGRQDEIVSTSGYVRSSRPDHPLADSSGQVYEHRRVLHEAIGDGPHPCHWCKKSMVWGGSTGIHVDHLDGDKLNNGIENLVPACHRCNSTRGLFQTWVMEHRDDPFLAKLFEAALSSID